jgi:hypothetical protein
MRGELILISLTSPLQCTSDFHVPNKLCAVSYSTRCFTTPPPIDGCFTSRNCLSRLGVVPSDSMSANLALLQENQRTLISIHNIVFILFILSNSFKAGIYAGLLMINFGLISSLLQSWLTRPQSRKARTIGILSNEFDNEKMVTAGRR